MSESDTGQHRNHKGECQVCLDLIQGVVKMCPSCNAIFCQSCIDSLTINKCPCCRSPQTKTSYVRNRFAEETIKEMEMDRHLTCMLHGLEKYYFCTNKGCQKALCPDCFIEDHIGHSKKPIQTVYIEGKQEVVAVIETIDEKIREF